MSELLLGLSLGLAAGISPGPLLVLVITSALRSGWRAGAVAACAPLVSDLVIVSAVLLVLDHLPARSVSVLGLVGGLFVVFLGVTNIREARTASLVRSPGSSRPLGRAMGQAALTNLLSPHPWLAWATALGPLTIATWRHGHGGATALVVGFYLTLVGTKIVLAVLVAGARHRLSDRAYRSSLIGAGALLVVVGVALLVDFLPQAL